MSIYERSPLEEKLFLARRRDVLLGYPFYKQNLEDEIETFEIVTQSFSNKAKLATLSADRPMVASEQRAWDAIKYLHLQYTAGIGTDHLRSFYPTAIEYWEEYAKYHEAFHKSPEAPYVVAHLTLQDDSYWDAIRLTSFGILLGHTDLLPRLCAIWDYGDQPLDGLLERLVASFVPGRAAPPDECTRHLPYFKLLKVFAAEPAKRPALMAKYMDQWYTASRREPYYDSHTKGRNHSYLGYWSFEAAAVSCVLDIDDASYRDKDFYPRDLADFARSLPRPAALGGSPVRAADVQATRLRCEAGQPCPREGWWHTPAKAGSRRQFKTGEPMPEMGSDYGQTIWQWDDVQS